MRTIRIGSRESRLAVVQSELVQKYLESQGVQAPIVTMKTTGDKILDRTLDQVGGKGLFVKELDAALLDGRSDISVHSLKDVPVEINSKLPLIGFSKREDPRDVQVRSFSFLYEAQLKASFSEPLCLFKYILAPQSAQYKSPEKMLISPSIDTLLLTPSLNF